MLGLPVDGIKKLQENKWMYLMGSMFVCNTIKNGLTQTGAFEVYVNNNLVFSKLASGRIFQPEEIQLLLLENGIILK